jgi:hypothetical protein
VDVNEDWPTAETSADELPARLCTRLERAGIFGMRSVGFVEQSEGLGAQVSVFPLTDGRVGTRIAEVCRPFKSWVIQGSEQPARRC